MATTTTQIFFHCPVEDCDVVSSWSDIVSHVLATHNHRCHICFKILPWKKSLIAHVRHHFWRIRPYRGVCRRCGKPYKVEYWLKKHEQRCDRIQKIRCRMPGFDQLPELPNTPFWQPWLNFNEHRE